MKKETKAIFIKIKKLIDNHNLNEAYIELWNNFINNYNNIDEKFNNFIDVDLINCMIEDKSTGWQTIEDIYFRIKNIDFMNENIFYIDAYGNLRNITKEDIEILFDEIYEEVSNQE